MNIEQLQLDPKFIKYIVKRCFNDQKDIFIASKQACLGTKLETSCIDIGFGLENNYNYLMKEMSNSPYQFQDQCRGW